MWSLALFPSRDCSKVNAMNPARDEDLDVRSGQNQRAMRRLKPKTSAQRMAVSLRSIFAFELGSGDPHFSPALRKSSLKCRFKDTSL